MAGYWVSAPEIAYRLVSLIRDALVEDAASRLTVAEDRMLLDIRYLARCSLYTLRLLEEPSEHGKRYEDPVKLAWSIIRRGARRLVSELSQEDTGEGKRLPPPARLGRPIRVEAPSGVRVDYKGRELEVYLVADIDIYDRETGEAALIRLSGSRGGTPSPDPGPPRHHLEELAAAVWSLGKSGYPVGEKRIIYIHPDTGQMIEYRVEIEPSEPAIRERIRLLFNGELAPCYSFECNVCPFRGSCPLAATRQKGVCEEAGRYGLRVKPLYAIDKLRVDWDPTMELSSRIHEALMRLDIEHTAAHVDSGAGEGADVISVTHLSTCPLKYWFSKRMPYTSTVPSPYLVRGRLLHNGVEEALQNAARNCRLLKKHGLRFIDVERKVRRTLDIGGRVATLYGRADVVLTTEDCSRIIVELKTYTPDRWIPDDTPRETHRLQASAYMTLLDADRGYVVYFDPSHIDEDTVHAFSVERTPHQEILDEAKRLLTPSPGDMPRYKWECRYCPFREVCPIHSMSRNHGRENGQEGASQ